MTVINDVRSLLLPRGFAYTSSGEILYIVFVFHTNRAYRFVFQCLCALPRGKVKLHLSYVYFCFFVLLKLIIIIIKPICIRDL